MKMDKNLKYNLKEKKEVNQLEENLLLSPEKQKKFNNWLKDQIFQMKSKFESSIELKSYRNTLSIIQEEINESQYSKWESFSNNNYDLKNSIIKKTDIVESNSESGSEFKLKNRKLIDDISIREIQEKFLNKKKENQNQEKESFINNSYEDEVIYEDKINIKKNPKIEVKFDNKNKDNLKKKKYIYFQNKNIIKNNFENFKNNENIRKNNSIINISEYEKEMEKDEKLIFPKHLESIKLTKIKKTDKRKNLILKEKFDFKRNKLRMKKKEKLIIKNYIKKSQSSDLFKNKILNTSLSLDKNKKKQKSIKKLKTKNRLFNSFTKKNSLNNIFKKKNFSFIIFNNKKLFHSKKENSILKRK